MDTAQAQLLIDEVMGKIIAGWAVSGVFGKGKSAVVLKASKEGVEAALKIFHPELIERYGKHIQLERIIREKSLIGSDHPNLVKILDGGECSITGYLFVVMEKINMKNMHEALELIPIDSISGLITQVASAARFLEDRGLAHRDIKPENIAVSHDFSKAVLLDLGVLRPIGYSDLTDVDQRPFIGTLRYSSPEYLLREEEDSIEGWRSLTFYQIGAVLHDLIMKKVIFDEFSEPFGRLVKAVVEETPKIYGDCSRCVALANHCLVKNPKTRLMLVKWDDFIDLQKNKANKMNDMKEAIKARQLYSKEVAKTKSPTSLESGFKRKVLVDLGNRLESRIAAVLNDLAFFPLREVKSEVVGDYIGLQTRVDFEADTEKGLDYKLCIKIETNFLDFNNNPPLFTAKFSALLVVETPLAGQFKDFVEIISGDLIQLLDGERLEECFLMALQAVYEVKEKGLIPAVSEPLSLHCFGEW